MNSRNKYSHHKKYCSSFFTIFQNMCIFFFLKKCTNKWWWDVSKAGLNRREYFAFRKESSAFKFQTYLPRPRRHRHDGDLRKRCTLTWWRCCRQGWRKKSVSEAIFKKWTKEEHLKFVVVRNFSRTASLGAGCTKAWACRLYWPNCVSICLPRDWGSSSCLLMKTLPVDWQTNTLIQHEMLTMFIWFHDSRLPMDKSLLVGAWKIGLWCEAPRPNILAVSSRYRYSLRGAGTNKKLVTRLVLNGLSCRYQSARRETSLSHFSLRPGKNLSLCVTSVLWRRSRNHTN